MKKISAFILSVVLVSIAASPVASAAEDQLLIDGIYYSSDMKSIMSCTELYSGNESFIVPENVEIISDGAFMGNSSILDITLSTKLKSIEKDAFLKSRIEFVTFTSSSNIESIDDCAFEQCSGLKNIEIPDSVSVFGENVFKDCTSLEKIKLPELSSYPSTMFLGCTSLREIIINIHDKGFETLTAGDVTSSNGVTPADARYTLRLAASIEKTDKYSVFTADVNRDGKITAADARTILRITANLE